MLSTLELCRACGIPHTNTINRAVDAGVLEPPFWPGRGPGSRMRWDWINAHAVWAAKQFGGFGGHLSWRATAMIVRHVLDHPTGVLVVTDEATHCETVDVDQIPALVRRMPRVVPLSVLNLDTSPFADVVTTIDDARELAAV
jgi:hypothetical protein